MQTDVAAHPTALFDYEALGEDHFRARPTGGPMARLYGGQVIAQALAAAQRTVVATRPAHSCHAYFVRGGRPDLAIDFVVERDSDGRSFSARRVAATQAGRLILSLAASFHDAEPGPRAQADMPDVPPPEDCPGMDGIVAEMVERMLPRQQAFWRGDSGIEFRAVEPFITFDPPPRPARRHFWFRTRWPLGDDVAEHQRLFAYASDLYLMHTGLLPLGISWVEPAMQDASLDHAIWFHDRFRVDEWLLYALDSPHTGGARTLGRGTVFAADGRLVASVAQEGLVRLAAVSR